MAVTYFSLLEIIEYISCITTHIHEIIPVDFVYFKYLFFITINTSINEQDYVYILKHNKGK